MASEAEKTLRNQLRALGDERTPDRTAVLVDLATLMDDQVINLAQDSLPEVASR